ncbi:hypothetical protein ABZP36_026799 [Zizania latifolia]
MGRARLGRHGGMLALDLPEDVTRMGMVGAVRSEEAASARLGDGVAASLSSSGEAEVAAAVAPEIAEKPAAKGAWVHSLGRRRELTSSRRLALRRATELADATETEVSLVLPPVAATRFFLTHRLQ